MLEQPPMQSSSLHTRKKSESIILISSTAEPTMSSSNDQLMTDTPTRPSLSTSLSDFALSSSTSNSPSSSMSNGQPSLNSMSKDDSAPLMKRLRRPTIHNWWMPEHRTQSPLSTSSITLPIRRSAKGKERCIDNDADGTDDLVNVGEFRDKDSRMVTDSSSPSSESDVQTPPLRLENSRSEELSDRPKSSPMDISRSASPAAAALKPPADIVDASGPSRHIGRRLSHPLKPPRLLTLRLEAQNPEDSELKSEAQFQRFIAHSYGLPTGLRNGRSLKAPSDRGRYPEEAVAEDDEFQREETPSDDELDAEADVTSSSYMTYKAQGGSDPINITKPSTPAPSITGTPEDLNSFNGIAESPGNVMDIDVPMSLAGSPSIGGIVPPPMQWRQTPPPTASSAVRTSKRKYDDRFEPYAPSAKRRAVSPSISHLKDRDSYSLVSPIVIPRSPILKPRKSFSQNNSATSSPTVSQSSSYAYGFSGPLSLPLSQNTGNGSGIVGHHRSGSSSSVASPTVRSIILASPILRPIPRLAGGIKRLEEEERIVDGAGENLRELNIGR